MAFTQLKKVVHFDRSPGMAAAKACKKVYGNVLKDRLEEEGQTTGVRDVSEERNIVKMVVACTDATNKCGVSDNPGRLHRSLPAFDLGQRVGILK